jgi:hypothetical protein
MSIGAFSDGTRSTYFVANEDVYPVFYARNAALVRTRTKAGFHNTLYGLKRSHITLLAPFELIGYQDPSLLAAYEALQLLPTPYADLCWTPADDDFAEDPSRFPNFSNLAWQARAQRRARRLMEITEQIVAIAGARTLEHLHGNRSQWLLKDGSAFQFDKKYLRSEKHNIQNIVSCVKSHPVAFFGVAGERVLMQLSVGQRSSVFLPRPIREVNQPLPSTLETTARPIVSWYLRVAEPNPTSANPMSGVVRLDIAATDDWQEWVNEVSWSVLDEFYELSARPDPRFDVMPYGIFDCEQALKAEQLPGELLMAQLC